MRPLPPAAACSLRAVAVCLAGALLFSAAGTVLPWMLGPLVAMAAAKLARWPVAPLHGGLQAGQLTIGLALGLYFTAPVVQQLVHLAPYIAIAAMYALVLGAACALLLRRLASCDLRTAFFASLPGGAAEMSLVADRVGARGDWVAAAQALRIVIVVLTVPALLTWSGAQGGQTWVPPAGAVHWPGLALMILSAAAAAWALRALNVPNAWVIGALAVSMALTASGIELSALPRWAVNAAQLLVGCALGNRFDAEFFRGAPRLLAGVAVSVLVGMLLSAGFAILLAAAAGTDLPTTVLATAPGGVAEMSLTAKVLHLGVPVVVAFHVSRMAFLVLAAAPVFRLALRLRSRHGARRP